MLRRICVVAVVVATLVALSPDLGACGDKFLRAGRSARFRRYATIYPASILLYAPAPAWTNKGVRDFEGMLRTAGHKPFAVRNAAAIAEALSARKYDVVIAVYADAATIEAHLATVPSRPVLVPVLYRPAAPVEMEAARAYQCVIRPDKMNKFQALEKIDEFLGMRFKGASTAGGLD